MEYNPTTNNYSRSEPVPEQFNYETGPPPPYPQQGGVVVTQPGLLGKALVGPPPGSEGEVRIRNTVESDRDFVARLSVEAFRSKMEWAVGKVHIEGLIRAMSRDHEKSQSLYDRTYIAEYQGRPAGLLQLKYHKSKAPNVDGPTFDEVGCCGMRGIICLDCMLSGEEVRTGYCYIDHICVDEGFRGKGIGKVLMERATYEALAHQCHTIFLWVARDNRAKNLYERQGFKLVEEEDGCCCCLWCATGIRVFYKMEKTL